MGAFAFVGLGTGPVEAHPESTPALVNRYVTFTTHGDAAFVSVALLFGSQPGAGVRHQADSNGDRHVDASEQEALRHLYQAQAARWLSLYLDGSEIAFTPDVTLDLGTDLSVAGGALVAEGILQLQLPPGTVHECRLVPKAHPPPQGETEVSTMLGPGWGLRPKAGKGRSVKTQGPTPPGFEVSFAFEKNAATPSLSPWRLPLVLSVALGVVGVIWFCGRRVRRPKNTICGPPA